MKRLGDILNGGRILGTSTSSGADAGPIAYDPPDCALCNDAGFVRLRREPGQPGFGELIPCHCAHRRARDDQDARLQRYSNLGPLSRLRFEALDADRSAAFRRAYDAARAFAAGEATAEGTTEGTAEGTAEATAETPADGEAPWLVLWGAHGSGKTALGAAMANARIARGRPALYFVTPDLLDHLRAAYGKNAGLPYPQLFEKVRNAPFLVLDDLDASNLTAWAEEKLFQLMNHRDQMRLPTVVLCRADPAALSGSSQGVLRRIARLRPFHLDPGESAGDAGGATYREIGGMKRERLEQLSFDRFKPEGRSLSADAAAGLRSAHQAARSFAEQPDDHWLTLVGPYGCGKTHLAAAIARERLAAGDEVYFVVVPDLLDHLRSTFNPRSDVTYDEVFEQVRTTQLLVLDDLGAQTTSPWAQEKLYQIFSFRYINRLPTVVTTNFRAGEIDERIASRIFDSTLGTVITINAPDYRSGRAPRDEGGGKDRRGVWATKRW